MCQNVFAAGVPPWAPLEELTALPRPSSWIREGVPVGKGEGKGMGGKGNGI